MNNLTIHQKGFATGEEMRGSAAACRSVEMKDLVFCPKPRRPCLLPATLNQSSQVRPLRWHSSLHQEGFDAKAGNELLDFALTKGPANWGMDQSAATAIASSPPFFSGSPPIRVSNPLTQDSRFGNENFTPVSPQSIPTPSDVAHSPSTSAREPGGCVRATFGSNPGVRIEGFDCLDRDRRGRGISTVA